MTKKETSIIPQPFHDISKASSSALSFSYGHCIGVTRLAHSVMILYVVTVPYFPYILMSDREPMALRHMMGVSVCSTCAQS